MRELLEEPTSRRGRCQSGLPSSRDATAQTIAQPSRRRSSTTLQGDPGSPSDRCGVFDTSSERRIGDAFSLPCPAPDSSLPLCDLAFSSLWSLLADPEEIAAPQRWWGAGATATATVDLWVMRWQPRSGGQEHHPTRRHHPSGVFRGHCVQSRPCMDPRISRVQPSAPNPDLYRRCVLIHRHHRGNGNVIAFRALHRRPTAKRKDGVRCAQSHEAHCVKLTPIP